MLTRGSLVMIYEELGESEKVVACFVGICQDSLQVTMQDFCKTVPQFLQDPFLDLVYEVSKIDGVCIDVSSDRVQIHSDDINLNVKYERSEYIVDMLKSGVWFADIYTSIQKIVNYINEHQK